MDSTRVDIPQGKAKMLFLMLGSILFVALGVFMVLNAQEMQTKKFPPIWIMGFGIIAILFFGSIGLAILKKMFSKKAGLAIDVNGIWDNSSGVSVGFIAWEDITGIRKVSVSGTKFLLIDVRNPNKYINKMDSGIKKLAMKANNRKYGTPISISSNGLSIKFKALEELIRNAFEQQN
tara:strand:+ start:2114 stop:2644 length:531 start_codon:yes stop_codon:yes gene_type:complete